jgi:PBSX family phage portal protein
VTARGRKRAKHDAQDVVRVRVVENTMPQASNAVPIEEQAFADIGALPPPISMTHLCRLYEESSALRPNVEAYATNIGGFGFQLDPTIDLKEAEAAQKIEESLLLEKLFDGELPAVTDEDVRLRTMLMESTGRLEKIFLKAWFKRCCAGELTFDELRERSRTDLEVTGNCYWEILRDEAGKPAMLTHVESVNMRLMPLEKCAHVFRERQRISDTTIRLVETRRKFRRFVQLVNGVETVFFKEYGDPRVYSSRTGTRYASIDALHAQEGCDCPPATEILHRRIYAPNSPYGVPRWVGATCAVSGTRASEEVNYAYFDEKCIPPMLISVEGAVLGEGAEQKIQEIINDKIKGRQNAHQIMIIEAPASRNPMGASSNPSIKLQPLTQFLQQDAANQIYEGNNAEKIGQQFRLPRLLRGQMTDFNRATADAAIEYAEQQVIQPERNKEDHQINRLLVDLGVSYWTFRSSAPIIRNTKDLCTMILQAVEKCTLTPAEGRELLKDVFGREFKVIDEPWANGPVASIKGASSPAQDAVRELVAMRAALDKQEETTFQEQETKLHEEQAAEVIEVPSDIFRSLFRQAS